MYKLFYFTHNIFLLFYFYFESTRMRVWVIFEKEMPLALGP